MFEDSSRAKLIKIDPKTLDDRIAHGYFHEVARWDVTLDDLNLGQVWKTQDGRGRTCWGICVPFLKNDTLMGTAVISGYSATTKKGAVWNLFEWHKNRNRSFELDGVVYHCGRYFDRYGVEEMSFLAEFPAKMTRNIFVTHVKEEKPREGAMGRIGWHASANRGHTRVYARCCESLIEAVSLIRPELEKPLTAEDKKYNLIGGRSIDLVGTLAQEAVQGERIKPFAI